MKKSLVIHPFLFATFHIVFLFAHNIALMSIDQIVIPLAITILVTLLLFSLLRVIFKDWKKAGLMASGFLLLFFSYGHFYEVIADLCIGSFIIGRHRYLLFTYSMLFIFSFYLTIKTRTSLDNLTGILNVTGASLVLISLINIGVYEVKTRAVWQGNRTTESNLINSEKPGRLPNIYYIILDAYARADILKEMYQYDNSKFLDCLAQKGFYIASKSRANYCQSYLSLASSLNITYLNDLANQIGIESDDRRPLSRMMENNYVFNFLKQYGYVFVVYDSGWAGTKMKKADVYVSPRWLLGEFVNVLIWTTPIRVLGALEVPLSQFQYNSHRKRILHTCDHLANIPEQIKGPFFVFAHIFCPHSPFVFGEHGEQINPNRPLDLDGRFIGPGQDVNEGRKKYREGYKKQISFVSKLINKTIDKIISNSSESPIIILQSDHGPCSMFKMHTKERMSILNAYYLPDNGSKHLYDEITPVNTFRIIFNHYFGANYQVLKDKSYSSTRKRPYKFINFSEKNE